VCGQVQSAPHPDVGPPVFTTGARSLGFGSRDGDDLWWRLLELP
jgi:hypothetical protein